MKFRHLILFLLIFTKGYSQEKLGKTIKTKDYSINYSSEWKLDETGRQGAAFYLFYSPTSGKFGNNINLLVQDLKGMGLNLASYTEISESQINDNGKLISSNKKLINGLEFQEIKFEAVFNNLDVKFLQYYFLKDEKAYVLTYTALKNEFDGLLPEALKIMNSFLITPN